MSEAALPPMLARRIGLVDLLRPPHIPSPEARAALREAEAWRRGRAEAAAEAETRLAAAEAERLSLVDAQAKAERLAAAAFAEQGAALEAAFAASLASLALAIARAVLATEPGPRPETIAALARSLVSAAPADAAARLRAHPSKVPLLAPLLPPGWTAQPDPALPPDALVAELDPGELTASLAARLDQLAAELLGAPA